ncbi:hypothetical protein FNV43_RR02692 [Rhamnella rubrinervis]|uniref:Uncharacterized protein n=1 Tax=Rhamnella rubrinervis TaxID=2594499 RepID=A0A8K0HTB7_9ROSA|nr:hypothetical protein FNV43_RR02692 [Rhamnella rubrinervis]
MTVEALRWRIQESFEFNDDVITMSALDVQMRRSFRTWRKWKKMKVLPSNSAAFRCIGVIPKPNKLQATQEVAVLRKELEEYKRREKGNNATHVESLKKNEQLEGRLAKMEKKVKILLELHERQFDSFDRIVNDLEAGNDTENGDDSNQGCAI